MSAPGYIVKGIGRSSERTLWATRNRLFEGLADTREKAATFGTVPEAIGAMAQFHACRDVRILAVAEDGTETPLPTYEEALAEIDGAHAYFDGMPVPTRERYPSLGARAKDVCDFVVRHETGKSREALSARDALLSLLDRIDTNSKSLPEDVREEIAAVLAEGRKSGWRPAT